MKDILIQRLSTYVQMDTQSDENSETCPLSLLRYWKASRLSRNVS